MLTIENRAGVDVLVMGNGCRPASEAESAFYAEITRLRAEVEALKAKLAEYSRANDRIVAELRECDREVEALRADNKHLRGEFEKAWPDAERYRWITAHGGCPFAETDSAWDGPEQLAAAIEIQRGHERRYEEFRARAAQGASDAARTD